MKEDTPMSKLYPDSHIEIQGFAAKHYDALMNVMLFGSYGRFIKEAVAGMDIQPQDRILDLGCGTGRNARLMRSFLNEKGYILGMDISEEMGRQFRDNNKSFPNVEFKLGRIDESMAFDQPFDKVFISFVLHGFPHEIRPAVIRNAFQSLKPGGVFCILDFAEFSLKDMPFYYRIPFKKVECPYAFDFIERDWKAILRELGFDDFSEKFWLKKYARLLKAEKREGKG